ncbi:D-alanyl-D-alanine carboxypeptidase/D-alanyl-D-alanine-endopeptidase [Phormidesmis sp. 146-12]
MPIVLNLSPVAPSFCTMPISPFSRLLVLSLTLILQPVRTLAAPSTLCPTQLPAAIDRILGHPDFARSRWGALIQTEDGKTLYDRDAQRYFIPASTTKLLTTAAALDKLGAQFRIRTSIYGIRSQMGWALRVVGRGDPTLTDLQLVRLAQQLSRQGIQQVEQLTVEDSDRSDPISPDWTVEDAQAGYGAPVNRLIVNGNAIGLSLIPQAIGQPLRVQWDDPNDSKGWQIENNSVTVAADAPESLDVGRDLSQPILKIRGQLRVGAASESVSVAIVNPAQNFLQQLRQALAKEKITVKRAVVVTRPDAATGSEVAFVESPSLSAILKTTNQDSNNLYAESLLRLLGTKDNTTTIDQGMTTLISTLKTLGVNSSSFLLVDGSGLARQNLISPQALVQTLRSMSRHPAASIYRSSLPTAGVSGTLQNRFRGTAAQGIVQAKTGSLTGVSALSGYLAPPNYSPIVFSVIVNQSTSSATVQREAIDEVVLLLTKLRSCN